MKRLFVAIAVLCALGSAAEARRSGFHHHRMDRNGPPVNAAWFSESDDPRYPKLTSGPPNGFTGHEVSGYQIVPHPKGCPIRLSCGCIASVRIFGHSVRHLWPARAWYRFQRAHPAPGMVAVRQHHVFVLERYIEGSLWEVFDGNSGGHLTRIHPRDISGWTIVNPTAQSGL
jgi:hypothetical protein